MGKEESSSLNTVYRLVHIITKIDNYHQLESYEGIVITTGTKLAMESLRHGFENYYNVSEIRTTTTKFIEIFVLDLQQQEKTVEVMINPMNW